MAEGREVEVRIGFTRGATDGLGAIETGRKLLEQARAEIAGVAESGGVGALALGSEKIARASAEVENMGFQLDNAYRQAALLQSQIAETTDPADWRRLQGEILETGERIAVLSDKLKRSGRDMREGVFDSAGFLGDIDSGLSTIGGALTSFGSATSGVMGGALSFAGGPLSGIGGAMGQTGEIFAVLEALPRLSAGLDTLKQNVSNAVGAIEGAKAAAEFVEGAEEMVQAARMQGIVLTEGDVAAKKVQAVATAEASAASMGLAGSLNVFLASAAPVLLPLLAAGTAFATLTAVTEHQNAASREAIDARQAALDSELKYAAMARDASSESVQARIEEIEMERAIREASLQEAREHAAQETNIINQLRTIAGHALGDTTVYGLAGEAMGEAGEELEALGEESERLRDEVLPLIEAREAEREAIQAQIAAIQRGVSGAIQTAKDLESLTSEGLEDRLDALEVERRAIQNALPELEAMAAESDEAAEALEGYRERLESIAYEGERLAAIAPRIEAREIREASEDIKDAYADFTKTASEAMVEETDALADEREKASERRQDIIEKAEDAVLKAEEDYAEKRAELVEKYDEAEMKRLEDWEVKVARQHKDILRAAEANDIQALIALRETMQEEAEDEERAARRRAEQHAEELAEAEKARDEAVALAAERKDEELALLREENAERLAEIREGYAEERAALREALAEKVADIWSVVGERAGAPPVPAFAERPAPEPRMAINDPYGIGVHNPYAPPQRSLVMNVTAQKGARIEDVEEVGNALRDDIMAAGWEVY